MANDLKIPSNPSIKGVKVKYRSSVTKPSIIVLQYPKAYLDMKKTGIKIILENVFRQTNPKKDHKKLGDSLFFKFKIKDMISFLENKKDCLIISQDLIDIFDYISFYKNQTFTAIVNLIEDNSVFKFSDKIIKTMKEIYYYDKLKIQKIFQLN